MIIKKLQFDIDKSQLTHLNKQIVYIIKPDTKTNYNIQSHY